MRVAAGNNLHVVLAGRVFRSAQMSGAELEKTARANGIRTVINLRGSAPPIDWYLDECRVTHKLGICQEDVGLQATRFPSVTEVRRLVEVLDHCEYPVLLHCRQGADRTGLASVIVCYLQTDLSLDQARRQLSWRYGHLKLNHTDRLDQFLNLYERWLTTNDRVHSAEAFRKWLWTPNCPGKYSCKIDVLKGPADTLRQDVSQYRVRVTNTGQEPWRLTTDNCAGNHLGYYVLDDLNRPTGLGRAGLIDARVPAQGHIDLTLVVRRPPGSGRLRLVADMLEEQHCFFHNAGSEPLVTDLENR
jgi:protein tyrosine phosphatase (PTP) superfamily phosphohydrolase (DUF442 family)